MRRSREVRSRSVGSLLERNFHVLPAGAPYIHTYKRDLGDVSGAHLNPAVFRSKKESASSPYGQVIEMGMMAVLQLNVPSVCRYSVVNQNFVSSAGSTTMLE